MIRLIRDQVAVVPVFDPDKTPGGLYIPDIAKQKCDQGLVKYVAPDVKELKIGDYVLFPAYSGNVMRLEGEGLVIIISEEFVACIIDPPETEIPGLFFKDKDGTYWEATYEIAIELCSRALTENSKRITGYDKEERQKSKIQPNEFKRGI